jgi:mRNA interferase RelE/StbE
MSYKIKVSKAFEKFFEKRTAKEKEILKEKLNLLKLNPKTHPQLDISVYKGEEETYRLRYRSYRIIYRVQEQQLLILLLKAGSRGDVYK